MLVQRWFNSLIVGRYASLALATIATLGWASSAHAALIVNDTWQDSSRTDPVQPTYSENGVDSDLDTDIESLWYNSGTGATLAASPGHLVMDIPTGSASWTTYFPPEATPITLNNPGDAIKVTWAFTTGDVNATNASQNFRIGLVDSLTRITADGTPAGTMNGFAIFGNMGETFGHASPFNLRGRTNQSAFLSASGDWGTNIANGATNGNVGYADNTPYTLVWTITRNASSNLDIAVTITGGNINGAGSMTVSALNVAPNGGSYSFDTFGLRPSGDASSASQLDTTLFRVEKIVPEPTSLLLMGLGSLALAAIRRQH